MSPNPLKQHLTKQNGYYIIAEVGVNHEGSIDLAKKNIELAKEGGAHAVKFQSYKAEKLACKNSPAYWDTTKESTESQFSLFKKYDSFGPDEYWLLKEFCDSVGIEFMSTPFDIDAVNYLDDMVKCFKVASADLTNTPLLREIGQKSKPVILSTGASTFAETERAIAVLEKSGCTDVSLLHCVLNYPTDYRNAYLGRIEQMRKTFSKYVIGYSDHTLAIDSCFPVITAYTLGARIIEKHFTHDKTLPGNDHYHAMDVNDLKAMVSKLEEVRLLLGGGDENSFIDSQSDAITHARRSIVAKEAIPQGAVLTADNLIVKRPGHGICPTKWDDVIGTKSMRDIDADMPLSFSDVEDIR